LTAPGTPLHEAGLDEGDVIVSIGNKRVSGPDDVAAALAARKPGESIPVQFQRRGATTPASVTLMLGEDREVELVTVESTGGKLTAEQRAFRAAWLGSRVTRQSHIIGFVIQ
jgi:predicted metalloprotease with PDZ domain